MTFIAQIVIPEHLCPSEQFYMAYVFMTGAGLDSDAIETWSPEDGETEVIVQSSTMPPFFSSPYPSLLERWEHNESGRVQIPCEYFALESPRIEAKYQSFEELDQLPDGQRTKVAEGWRGNKIGGAPYWLQGEEFPFRGSRLLLQLEDGSYPFALNLGTGIGYVFIDQHCRRGALLWQC